MEATRIRLVSNPTYAPGMLSGLTKIARTEGFSSLYAGFLPLICKQIPYAIGQVIVALILYPWNGADLPLVHR